MRIIVRESDNVITMFSENGFPTPNEGERLVELTEIEADRCRAALNRPNSGIVYSESDHSFLLTPPPSMANAVPPTATSGNFMRALLELGWYDDIEAAVDLLVSAHPVQGKLAKILWTRASVFERYHPMVIQIASMIDKTSEDLDALFRLAGTYDNP